MLSYKRLSLVAAGLIVPAIFVSAIVTGCSTAKPTATTSATTAPATAAAGCPIGKESGKSGNQLWSENCNRCHNARSPTTYTRAQWDVIVHHMRVRASLTAEEARKIVDFLKAAD
jgi:hypothetical protein